MTKQRKFVAVVGCCDDEFNFHHLLAVTMPFETRLLASQAGRDLVLMFSDRATEKWTVEFSVVPQKSLKL